MKEIISNKKKGFLFGNEAVVRGALESGIGYAASYPGTPATEIGDYFASAAKDTGVYFEWSTNEKAALEGAAGAAFSGVKSLVSMKHYGLNVASDSLLPLVYLECPLVVVIADDPGCWSSVQTEQDSRWFSRLSKIPILEPSNSQEAKDMTKFAFQFSSKYKIPVLVRLTTRVCYSKSMVNFNKIVKGKTKGKFVKKEFKLGSAQTVSLHKKLLEKLGRIKRDVESSSFNSVEKGNGKMGVVTSGISYGYVKEAMQELNVKLPLLKIGFSYPFPSQKVNNFVKNLRELIVVEEIDPVLEQEIRKISNVKIHGKDVFSETGEFKPEHIIVGFSKILKKSLPKEITENISIDVPKRIPTFCAGCPHRSTFYAVKKTLGRAKIFGGDIGCYMLGAYAPYKMQDYIVAMGAGTGISHGISKTTGKKPVIFIGDSTFFHAGIPALINLVYNKSDVLLIVADNRVTAMCGQQPNPGTGFNAVLEQTKAIAIEDVARSCKADSVIVSNVYNFNQFCRDIKKAYSKKGVSVLVAKGACRLFSVRNMARKGVKWPRFEIAKQDKKLNELAEFDCPAIRKEKGRWIIDKNVCWGCTICKQLFPEYIRGVR